MNARLPSRTWTCCDTRSVFCASLLYTLARTSSTRALAPGGVGRPGTVTVTLSPTRALPEISPPALTALQVRILSHRHHEPAWRCIDSGEDVFDLLEVLRRGAHDQLAVQPRHRALRRHQRPEDGNHFVDPAVLELNHLQHGLLRPGRSAHRQDTQQGRDQRKLVDAHHRVLPLLADPQASCAPARAGRRAHRVLPVEAAGTARIPPGTRPAPHPAARRTPRSSPRRTRRGFRPRRDR